MSGLYADDILDRVARANDLVEVVQSYFPLKRAGKDYTALCPFHPEKTPSFTVSPSKQIFKCFGCGRGGSVFNFVMLKENVTFPEAVRILADRAGLELKSEPEARRRAGRRQEIRKVLDWATRAFQAALADETAGRTARAYLASRGFTSASIETFRIGFAPESWDYLLKQAERAGVPRDGLAHAGLVSQRDGGPGPYDRFRNRVIFPILDPLNRPIAFGGRTLGEDPAKYLNSPETTLFRKAENLYGLPQARTAIQEARRAVVVEGYTDVVMAYQVGVANVVATLGTALTAEHVRVLKRYADEVVLVFDSDLAGRRAADRGLELFLAEDVRVYVAALPEGTDPFDICREGGAEAFRAHLDGATEALEYKWALVRTEFGAAESPAAQRRALDAMLVTLAQQTVLLGREPSVKRDLLLTQISAALGITEAALRAELARVRRRAGRSAAGREVGRDLPAPAVRGRRWAAERDLMTALVHRPSGAEEAARTVGPEQVMDEPLRRLYEAILASKGRRDGDVQSIVRGMDDPDVSALAVELWERGEAIDGCRSETDVGPGPLVRVLEEAVAAIRGIEQDEALESRSRDVREGRASDVEALRAFAEARRQHQGFLPPSARRRAGDGAGGGDREAKRGHDG